ncbi:MAG: CapA family protein [Lachnospiraceae bacterium]|nr:CapA family protein [Lachnospiraceae bacterium]
MKNKRLIKTITYLFLAALCASQLTGCRINGESARDIRERLNRELSAVSQETDMQILTEAAGGALEAAGDVMAAALTQAVPDASGAVSDAVTGGPAEAAPEGMAEQAGTSGDEAAADPAEAAGEEPPASVDIIMVGDILLHKRVTNAAFNDQTGEYDFNPVFVHAKNRISAADVAIVNQEVIIGGEELGISGYPTFNAPYAIGDALADAGFDVVCHATNHALDRNRQGLLNCLGFWREKHPEMLVTGIYDNAENALPENLSVIERNGIKIAVLNYTYGTNGINPPSDMPFAVSMLNEERVITQLDLAEQEVDFTIVCPHWGIEYNLGISAEQEKWAGLFREHGADAVIGTHPHVIEPVVFYEDDDPVITNNHGNGDMPVFYSLGNFVNATQTSQSGVARRMVGGMAKLTVSRKENGEVSLDDYRVFDYVCHIQRGFGNLTVYPLEEYTEELAAENLIRGQDPAFSKEYCEKLCAEVYGDIPGRQER